MTLLPRRLTDGTDKLDPRAATKQDAFVTERRQVCANRLRAVGGVPGARRMGAPRWTLASRAYGARKGASRPTAVHSATIGARGEGPDALWVYGCATREGWAATARLSTYLRAKACVSAFVPRAARLSIYVPATTAFAPGKPPGPRLLLCRDRRVAQRCARIGKEPRRVGSLNRCHAELLLV
jgi:hypothetical protein